MPRAAVHVDLDGLADIYAARGWKAPSAPDPVFETGMESLLQLLDEQRVGATLFVIADSARDRGKRARLREAIRLGHRVASHSLTHRGLLGADTATRRRELRESRTVLEQELGVAVEGFRAPGYGIDRNCVELLEECGYGWDSSAFPTPRHADRLGVPVSSLLAPSRPFPGLDLIELPLPDHRPLPWPCNPSYALVLGSRLFRWGIDRLAAANRDAAVLFHLIDVADPVPDRYLRGPRSRILTLSHLSRSHKLDRCRGMLLHLSTRFEIVDTAMLLAGVPPRAKPDTMRR